MNRLAHSRLFLSFLLMMLQLALLPGVGRCDSKLNLTSGCCCASEGHASQVEAQTGCCDEVVPSAPSCCSDKTGHDSRSGDEPEGEDPENTRPESKMCSCASPATPGPALLTSGEKKDHDQHHDLELAPIAPGTPFQSFGAVLARVRNGPVPKAPTGPPLHLLYQVFLI